MCGIGGTIDFARDARELRPIGLAMAQALAPRGPDDGGIYLDRSAMLVHRRLTVIDPIGGRQPMQSPDGNIILIYNGELYNTEDIRSDLITIGHQFEGHSDTEVVLHAFWEWGESAFERFNGIYALALWDRAQHRLTLCRDRLGVKPLFYAQRGSTLIFGSELKTLFCHPDVKPEIDEDGLRSVLLLGPARTPGDGVFRNVREVLPGHIVTFDREGVHDRAYWQLEAAPHYENEAETIAYTRALIEDAAHRQMVSDVPLCTFLSGGLDSSILSMLVARYYSPEKPLHTWSVDYKDNDKYFTKSIFQPNSDNKYIQLMADTLGTVHHRVELDPPALCCALLAAADARDLPGMADVDSSLLLFCRAVKQEFTVCLSGECADELFGGYPWYHRPEILFEDTFPWSRSLDLRLGLLREGVVRDGAEFVRTRYRATCDATPKLDGESEHAARMREMFVLNLQWFMATLLDRKDRMSMATGLEVRVPFCDHRIVEYAFNMPWELKALHGREKGIVRAAFADALPPEITERKKSPYPKTFSPDYTRLCIDYVRQILLDESSIVTNLFDRSALEALMDDPDCLPEPWYGQLMRGPQILAYLIQLDRWQKKLHVKLV